MTDNSISTGRFDIQAIASALPETATTLLADTYLTDRPEASARVFRVYRPTPAHYHATCDEYLYVFSGRGTFWMGDESTKAEFSPGQLLYFKRGTVHAMPELFEHPVVFLSIDTRGANRPTSSLSIRRTVHRQPSWPATHSKRQRLSTRSVARDLLDRRTQAAEQVAHRGTDPEQCRHDRERYQGHDHPILNRCGTSLVPQEAFQHRRALLAAVVAWSRIVARGLRAITGNLPQRCCRKFNST